MIISKRGEKLNELVAKTNDPRTLYWSPAPLSAQEREQLLDFAAYRELIKDHQSKDTEDAKEVVQWVSNTIS